MIVKKTVEIEVAFEGGPKVVEQPRGTFRGGVPDPVLGAHFGFNVLPEVEEADDARGPVAGTLGYDGNLQINLWGTTDDFRELGRYLLAIAELDSRADPGFHQHHEDLISHDGSTRLHVIVRKIQPEAA